jgi:hypothetical protein
VIHIPITDSALPGVEATFSYALRGDTLALIEVRIAAAGTVSVPAIQEMPLSRWEKRAWGTAMRRLLAAEETPERRVLARHPQLANVTHGNALRRWKSLVHLASVAAEYADAMEAGASNPAQTVGHRHNVSAATVRGWLHRARREGLAPTSTHPNAVGSRKDGNA